MRGLLPDYRHTTFWEDRMPHLTDRRYKALVERLINHEVQVDGNGNLVEIDPVPILDPEDGTFHEERLKFFAQLRDRGDAYTALTNDQIGSYDPDLRHTRPSDYTAIAALFAAIDRDINHRHNFSTMVEVVRMMLKMEYEECERSYVKSAPRSGTLGPCRTRTMRRAQNTDSVLSTRPISSPSSTLLATQCRGTGILRRTRSPMPSATDATPRPGSAETAPRFGTLSGWVGSWQ